MSEKRAAYQDLTHLSPEEARKRLLFNVTEKDFQRQVIALADRFQWAYFHPYYAQRSPVGFPDLVLARNLFADGPHPPPYLIFAELKTERGRMREGQVIWQFLLQRIAAQTDAIQYHVWRPSNLEAIATLLSGASVSLLTEGKE